MGMIPDKHNQKCMIFDILIITGKIRMLLIVINCSPPTNTL